MKELLDRMFLYAPEGNAGGGDGEQDQEATDDKGAEQDAPVDEKAPETVPYGRFKEVNQRLADATKALNKVNADAKKRAEEQAKEQGKFEELYQTEAQARVAAESRLMRLEVGIEMGLPLTLIDRLQGSTSEELKADAEQLKELIPEGKRSDTPNADPRRKKSGALDITNMSPEEIRQNTAKLLEQAKG